MSTVEKNEKKNYTNVPYAIQRVQIAEKQWGLPNRNLLISRSCWSPSEIRNFALYWKYNSDGERKKFTVLICIVSLVKSLHRHEDNIKMNVSKIWQRLWTGSSYLRPISIMFKRLLLIPGTGWGHKEAWKHKALTEPVGPWFTPKTWADIFPSLLEESKIRKFGTFFCDFCIHWMSFQQGTSHCSPIVNTLVSPIFIAESRENAIYIYCIAWDPRLFQLAERMGRGPSMGT